VDKKIMPREGILVKPYERLSQEQVEQIHHASLRILTDPGILCYNREAADIFRAQGAEVISLTASELAPWLLRIPSELILAVIETAPKVVKLGARNEENILILDGREPSLHFASGSEANIWLNVEFSTYTNKNHPNIEVELPSFHPRRGRVSDLCEAACLCEHLDSLDAFIRPVNIQDEDISDENKDVNKFFACLNNTTKHVMSGLTSLSQLDPVIRMAEIVTEGNLENNPIISFITCAVKSPLQLMDDTSQKLIEIARRGIPLVISSSPQGGSTAPITEDGIVAQINAEILTGIALAQLVRKGTPILYGSVPTRARMDDLNDSYGAPEFNQYNIDCVQIARFYSLPCYSTAGVADVKVPGVQASVEKLFSHILVSLSGPQYLHYAFGLLDRTNTFCPLQAVLDDAHIQMVKSFLKQPRVNEEEISNSLEQVRQVMGSRYKLYTRYVRHKLHAGEIAPPYPFESKDMSDEVLLKASQQMQELLSLPVEHLSGDTTQKMYEEIPGLLPRLNIHERGK
jgi:trimethylamine--corrinoid protein Co-methyltransferase